MLNPFPQFLIYSFYAPTLLRLGLAGLFAYTAVRTWRRAGHLAHVRLPLIGAQAWAPYLAGLAEMVVAGMFFAGWYTQVAALLGLAGVLKWAAYKLWWPAALEEYLPYSGSMVWLMALMCVSLLLSGAGAFAFDLPL